MRSVYRALTILIGTVGLIFLSSYQSVAENIYHWKDPGGISCYSNTNIPCGITEFSVMRTAWSATSQTDGPGVTDDTEGADAGEDEKSAADDSEEVSDSRVAILKERIEHRRTSIRYIENLLKTHPNDAGLRKRFYQKKQYLHADIIRLELLTK